jgi:hypothetical protein
MEKKKVSFEIQFFCNYLTFTIFQISFFLIYFLSAIEIITIHDYDNDDP